MTLASLFLVALSTQQVAIDLPAMIHPSDPLTAAAHASAQCDCPGPLENYLAYALDPASPPEQPDPNQSGGIDHLTIMTLVNERWGQRYDLGGFDLGGFSPEHLDQWHLWIEAGQGTHGS